MTAPRRALLVEDDGVHQTIGRFLLERLGFEVTVAASGADAVRATAEQDFTLILMDVNLPDIDGLEAVRRIRATDGGPRLIVGLSAGVCDEDRSACLAAGMDDYLVKPLRTEAIRAVLAA